MFEYLKRGLVNIPGWRTDRKIIVIESDDWGSIRMPSQEVYKDCINAGYRVDLHPYERYDSLASQDDLELLFDILTSFKDNNGNNPVLTANCVVANPDFEKIERENFLRYHYELITDTFKKYPNHSRNFELWQEGQRKKIFYPQFHAREHLNVSKFMKALQQRDPTAQFAFKNKMPGCITEDRINGRNYYVEATNFNSDLDKEEKLQIILEGLDVFERLFGYKSSSIMPPNFTWSNDFNQPVCSKGVKFFQGTKKMMEPTPPNGYKYYSRRLGQVNEYNQIDLIRNCVFEPTVNFHYDSVARCLSDISIAFMLNKPAVISTHRINFVGTIDHKNRDRNIKLFKRLISNSLKRWPEIEFMTSEDLGQIIKPSNNQK